MIYLNPSFYIRHAIKRIVIVTTAVSLSLAISQISSSSDNATTKLPIDAFASLPNIDQMKLSPNGEKIGYMIELEGRNAIVVSNLDGSDRDGFPAPEGGDFSNFYWANNNIILLQVRATLKRVQFNTKTSESRLYSFNLKKKKLKWLGEPRKQPRSRVGKTASETFPSQYERIIDLLPNDPKHILVELDFDLDAETSVYRVNVESGKRKEIRKDSRGIQNWFTNQESEIVYGAGYDGSKRIVRLKEPNGDWVNLNKTEWFKRFNFEDFTSEPNIIYVSGQNTYGTNGIFKLDLNSGEVIEKVFENTRVDIDGMVYHPITGKVAGVYYTTDFNRIKYFDKTLAKVQRSLSKALPNMVVHLVSMDAKADKYLILAQNDKDPGAYYLYNRTAKQLHYIAPTREAVFAEDMASAKMVDIPVRDGSKIPAVITMPLGKKNKNLPAVILPHGGPYVRGDNAHWHFWAQFYANRGYIVLQPNFRGSMGYGNAFYHKGLKQWGGLMQDDVTDATKWLISEGYADPQRICIAGASYGGYAALMGAIKEPNLYKCAISVNGATDLPRLKSNDKNNSVGGSAWIKRMALEGAEDKTISPHDRADEINIPVLIMSSVDDARINYRMSQATHKKLKGMGKDSTYVKIKDGTHHMVTKNARMVLLSETEKFLAKHIGPNSQYASRDNPQSR